MKGDEKKGKREGMRVRIALKWAVFADKEIRRGDAADRVVWGAVWGQTVWRKRRKAARPSGVRL